MYSKIKQKCNFGVPYYGIHRPKTGISDALPSQESTDPGPRGHSVSFDQTDPKSVRTPTPIWLISLPTYVVISQIGEGARTAT